MIYEFRTYDIKPGTLAEVEKRFAEAYEFRKTLSPLAAFWHTEIGPLNQIIHVWPYKSLDQRNEVRDQAHKTGAWPPSARAKTDGRPIESLAMQENKFMTAASFSPVK